jgi:Protein of unknown function (DUF3631)
MGGGVMTTTTLYADGPTVRVEITVKAQKVRYPVRVLQREPSAVLLNWDTVNPHHAKDRETLIAKLPADRQAEARPLVESLPDMVALASAALDADATKVKGPGTVLTYEEIEPWAHEVNGASLLDTLVETFVMYLVLPAGAADALALWVLFAYAHEAFDVSALVIVSSPTSQCGKTRLLEVLFVLTPKADLSVDPSDASLYRAIEEHHPSLLLDESDGLDFKTRKALRSLFNSRHYRTTAWVRRCVGDGAAMEVRNFSTWCPKVLAGIGRLPDTMTNRAVVIRMERKPRSARVEPFRLPRVRAALEPVRSQAARWARDHLDELRDAEPDVPEGLTDRQADNWRPLLAIAEAAGGAWPARARRAATALSSILDTDDVSLKEQLLVDVASFAAAYPEAVVPTAELLAHLHQMEERPWNEWGRQRKPMTPHALAAELRGFKVESEFKHEGRGGFVATRRPPSSVPLNHMPPHGTLEVIQVIRVSLTTT